MINKAKLSNFLRHNKLLFLSDKLRFYIIKFKNSKKNREFLSANPGVVLPPDYLMYESFRLDYERYYEGGRKTAIWLRDIFSKYKTLKDCKILDWGCGPARVVRHFPNLIDNSNVFGTDYNAESILWDKENIKNVKFNLNLIDAKLPYEDNFFDVIYGISIFTHLSEDNHFQWKKELFRVMKSNGLLLLTLQGDAYKKILNQSEKDIFDAGQIVVRGNVKEGHRTFSAFHPEKFVKELFAEMEVLEHHASTYNNGNLEQDVWLFKKND